MQTIEFKYNLDDMVTTLFGDVGIISMLGADEAGKQYYVKTKQSAGWFKETQLSMAATLTEG